MTQTSTQNSDNAIDTRDVIRQLQDHLLSLGRSLGEDTEGTLCAAEIDKTAKAINQLITSVERAEGYMRTHGVVRPGEGLSRPDRLTLIRKIKRMVENGLLTELEEADNA